MHYIDYENLFKSENIWNFYRNNKEIRIFMLIRKT